MQNSSALKWIAPFALAALATGCVATGPGANDALRCAGWRPIYVSDEDVLSEGTAEAILSHNLTGREACGW